MLSSDAIAARLAAIPAPLQGALLMTGAAFGFSAMNLAVRFVSAELDPLQITFFRNFFALLLILPWVAHCGRAQLRTHRLRTHMLRAVVGLSAMICWFWSIALLPLADAVALNFTVPLFTTAGAALILGERVGTRRWTATVVGFLGVLIILRPGLVEISPATALPIVAAVFMSMAGMFIKALSRSESTVSIVFYLHLFVTPLSLVPALFVWQWPSAHTLVLLVLLAFLALIAHVMLARAFAAADASAVMPFDYARLPFAAILAYFAFGEVADVWTWVGAGVIAGSAIYIARREQQVAARQPIPKAASEAVRGATP